MTSYVSKFFKSKRRKTESASEETTEEHGGQQGGSRPTSSNSSAPSGSGGASLSTTSSAAFLSPISTTNNSTDYLFGTMMSPSTSSPTSSVMAPQSGRLQVAGHRRQHSSLSAGHLQQHQQEQAARNAENIEHISRKRKPRLDKYDPDERPPKYKNRSAFYQSRSQIVHKNIRLILIEAETRVLYDTDTVIPVRYGVHPAAKSKSVCGEFQFLKKKKDTQKLSQMIFGAVPNLKTSESFRIHVLEEDDQILVSKTFAIPKYKKGFPKNPPKVAVRQPELSDSDSQSTVKSLDGWTAKKSRSIMSTPEGFNRVRHVSITFGEDGNADTDSNHFGSPNSSMSLPRAFSPPHRISKARRRQMAVTTSLSETSAFPIPSSLKDRSRMSSMSSSQADEEPFNMQNMRNVALGILVPIEHRYFLMQHIPLLESEMSRLETRIINASQHPATFLQNVSKSWEELTEIICQLHNAPRLKHPYWLALNEKCIIDGRTLATEFCEHLAYLVRRYDRKEAGYFMSNLVTALLMHHMSWVASVAAPPLGAFDRHQNTPTNMLFGMNNSESSPTVGYNALMAQYLEIAGACGNVRSAKLCILGDDLEILASVLSVLSFFIRCSAVRHIEPTDDDKMWEVPLEQEFSPIDVSGSPNSLPGCSHHHQNLNTLRNQQNALKSPPKETSSSAMMRRLWNDHDGAGPSTSSQPGPSQPPEIPTINTPTNEGVSLIDRADFPCCPTIADDDEMWSPRPNPEGLGRSMLAGPLSNYCPHFVLSALLKNNANMPDVYSRMFDEVNCTDSPCHRSSTSTTIHHQSVSASQSTSSICDPVINPENVLIVADIDHLTVKVLSSEGSDEVTSPSESVVAMLEQFIGIHDGVPATAEFLVGIIEDSLAQIVGKSLTLVELVRSDQTLQKTTPLPIQMTPDRVRSIIDCDHSDLRLIVNVAAVYWPPVLQSVLG